MGKIKRFEIEFGNANGVYYAGQQVTGKVHLTLMEAMKIKNVRIKFTGECSVEFDDQKKSTKKHSDREPYFEQVDIVFGSGDASLLGMADAGSLMESGSHSFPFVFNAPTHIPSSFEHKMGYVRYMAKAYLSRRLALDRTTKKAFSMVSLVDLNTVPDAFKPAYLHAEKRYSLSSRLLCCVNGMFEGGLSISVRLPRSAFVPGESIPISAEIENNSTLRVKRVKAYLRQNLIFNARMGGSRFVKGEELIGLLTQGEVKYGQSQSRVREQVWADEGLKLPPLPPTGLGGCRLINVTYLFYFVVEMAGADDVTLTQPITIGTIPLRDAPIPAYSPPRPPPPKPHPKEPTHPPAVPSAPPMPPESNPFTWPPANGAPFLPSADAAGPSAPPFVGPPPSYEECVFMSHANLIGAEEGEEGDDGNTTYRPLYPTYALSQAQQRYK